MLELLRKPYRVPQAPSVVEYPAVCIQLPLYNESPVAERVLRAAAAIEYPVDRLEIQVLDDSNDETAGIVDQVAGEIQRSGIQITVLRRAKRDDFKAGALRYGLGQTEAQFIAVFDADFVPPGDFLLKTVPYFVDKQVAFVQTRWGHINRDHSLLTKLQAILIDGHFMIEHAVRYACAFFNFNGTAGVWRRAAIESAGGWQGDTVTEDLDLSYRTLLAGWKAVYLRDVVCPAELPETIEAFKSQQFRWTKGGAQVCRKLLIPIFKSQLPWRYKIEAFFHLTANFCYLFVLIAALLLVPVALMRAELNLSAGQWCEYLLLICTICALFGFYALSQRLQALRVRPLDLVSALVLGMGMAAHCSQAVLSGLCCCAGEFIRTPKSGGLGLPCPVISAGKGGNIFNQFINVVKCHRKEFALAGYLGVGLVFLLQSTSLTSAPFLILLMGGYFLVLFSAVSQRVRYPFAGQRSLGC